MCDQIPDIFIKHYLYFIVIKIIYYIIAVYFIIDFFYILGTSNGQSQNLWIIYPAGILYMSKVLFLNEFTLARQLFIKLSCFIYARML